MSLPASWRRTALQIHSYRQKLLSVLDCQILHLLGHICFSAPDFPPLPQLPRNPLLPCLRQTNQQVLRYQLRSKLQPQVREPELPILSLLRPQLQPLRLQPSTQQTCPAPWQLPCFRICMNCTHRRHPYRRLSALRLQQHRQVLHRLRQLQVLHL